MVTIAPDDGNALPDEWELRYFGKTSRDGTGDFDGDGMSDLQEFIADTDPTNATSYLRIYNIASWPGGIRVDWQEGSNAIQYIQRLDTLGSTGLWLNIFTSTPPTPMSGIFVDPPSTNSAGYYRIKESR